MTLKTLPMNFSVCKLSDWAGVDLSAPYTFTAQTDEEKSLVCPTTNIPLSTQAREDGWRGLKIEGVLDFSLIGIIAKIAGILAENGISVFVISTYNTDYILIKDESFLQACNLLQEAGYEVVSQ